MSFKTTFEQYDWDTLEKEIYAVTTAEVAQILQKEKIGLEDLKL